MTAEAEARALSVAWDEALIRNDAPLVASFMTEDWVYVGPNGPVPKADIIGWIASGRLEHHSMTVVGADRVVCTGEAVVVTARKKSSGTWDGVPYRADEWITEVWGRTDGSWRCLLSHKTAIA
jgi:ketosteroid isomerase-like protein